MRVLLILSLCLLVVAPRSWAQDDSDGGFLTRTIENALSGGGREVKLTGFAGALSSQATFESLTIADTQGTWLSLEDVALNWSRTALLRGRLQVDSLTARSLRLERMPAAEEPGFEVPAAEAEPFTFELPELPVSINIDAFEVEEIDIGEAVIGVAARLNLRASVQFNDEGLDLRLDADRIDGVAGRVDLAANVVRDGSVIALDLSLAEAEGGIAARMMSLPDLPSVDLRIAGQGTLDDFIADIGFATAGEERLAGQVSLTSEIDDPDEGSVNRRILADLGGNVVPLFAPEYESFFGPDVGFTMNTTLFAGGSVNVQEFTLSARALDLVGSVQLNPELWPEYIDVQGRIAQQDGPVVLPGTDAGVSVQNVTLDVYYDTDQSNAVVGRFDVLGLAADGARVDSLSLSVNGEVEASMDSIGNVAANVLFNLRGAALADAAINDALGENIQGAARISYVEDAPVRIENLVLAGVDYRLRGDARVAGFQEGFPTNLDVEVAAADLSRFSGVAGQPLAGAAELAVSGSIVPLSRIFDVDIRGQTRDIALGIPQADNVLSGETNLSLNAKRDETGTFVRGLTLDNDALDVAADVALRSEGSEVDARIALSDVGLIVPEYQGPLRLDADARQTEGGWWQVDADLDAPYGGRASVVGLATGPDADLTFDVSLPDINPLVPAATGPLEARGRLWQSPEGYRIDASAGGPFGANVDVAGLATGPDARVDIDARLPDMGVLIPELSGALALTGEIGRAGAEDWAVDTRLQGPASMAADIAGTVAGDASTVDLAVTGQLPLGLAGPFLRPRSLTGPVAFDLAIQGPPELGSVRGTITTSNVVFSDPELKITLENVATRADLANSAVNLTLGADLKTGGRLDVGGRVDLTSLAADIAIGLRNATLIDPSLYAATLEADVSVNGPLTGGARIAGEINLIEVNVTVPEGGGTGVGGIPEITHIGASNTTVATQARAGVLPKEESEEASAPPAYPLDIRVNAPSKIFIRGRGLNAELGGRIRIRGDTNNVISSGMFDLIRGRFNIIGKRFDLDVGELDFQGSTTPYIKFVTTTEVPDGTASITVEGDADEPEITFSAVPEVPEDEVLSLILFGRYVSELSAFQALQLANGVSQLTGRSGIDVLGGLREGVGLDELNVSTDEAGTATVTAGKYITDTIYTDVSTNNESGTDISLNIDLTKDLVGKATVAQDGDSSIGLFFERDY